MTSPYKARLEQERANVVARRVALRRQIKASSSCYYGSGDFIDRRRALEAAQIALRVADREYEDVMVKLGRADELYQPPVKLNVPIRAKVAPKLRQSGMVRSLGYQTKIMTPQAERGHRPPIDWSVPLRREGRFYIARDVNGGVRYLPSTR